MEIKKDYDFNDLKNECYSGAENTLEIIEKYGLEQEFMEFLEEYFNGTPVWFEQVNDLLRFEDDVVFENVGLVENEDEIIDNLLDLIDEKFDDVIENINEIISEYDFKNCGVVIKDSENMGYDKIAYINQENSTCYCFKLDEQGRIIEIFY